MDRTLKIGIIGEYDPNSRYHRATEEALGHVANELSALPTPSWISTGLLTDDSADTILRPFDALWCAPGSPYKSMDGALRAIRFAREQRRPFIGT